jgi:hypothetical protein
MAHHQHVEVLVDRVHRVRARRIRRRRQDVGLAHRLDDVGRMAAAGAFGVIGVDRAALERGQRVLEEPGFVQRVGVDRHLDVVPLGDVQAIVDRRRRRAPVLVQLHSHHARLDLLLQWPRQARVALA